MNRKTKIMAVLGLLVLCSSVLAVDGNEPIAHWKFDEGAGTTAYDSVGDNHGTVHGAVWSTGQIDGALSFDGADDYVDCGTGPAITGTGDFAVSVWVKTDSDKGQSIVHQRSPSSPNGMYGLGMKNGRAHFQIYNSGYGFFIRTDVTVNDGLWHQIVAVRINSTDGEIYVDGSLAGTGSGPARSLNNVGVRIGRGFTGPYYFNGLIDDVRIYDRALSVKEIGEIYLDGLNLHGSELAIIHIEDAIAEKEEMLDVIDDALEKEDKAYAALEELLESRGYGDLSNRDIVKAKKKIHSAIQHEEKSTGGLEKSIKRLYDALLALGWEPEPEPPEPNEPELDPNLISHWKFDEGIGTIAYDSVGDNDGTIYGAIWTTGQIDGALSFDGINDYVGVPDDESLNFGTGSFSISAWIKIEGSSNGPEHTIVGKRKPTGDKNAYHFCVIDAPGKWDDSPGKLGLRTRNAFLSKITGVTDVNDGNWYHVVTVRNSNGMTELYVNGLLDAGDYLAVSDVDSDGFLGIGVHSTLGDNYFNGLIDDVRIYDKALSAEEIQQLYQDGL